MKRFTPIHRSHRMRFFQVGCLAGVLLLPQLASAQYTASYQTNTITSANSTNWGAGLYNIGDLTKSFDVLQVMGGGGLTNGYGMVGNSAPSSNNLAVVSGAGSLWNSTVEIYVGAYGPGNQLIVTNGGVVAGGSVGGAGHYSYIGYTNFANNNAVLVSGAGSLWTNRNFLYVGYGGSGNQLTISDSGQVVNTYGFIGHLTSSSNNTVSVGGAGARWNNGVQLFVGEQGYGNQLIVTNGGRVLNTDGFVGYTNAANNNAVLVSGAGSLWTNNGILRMGYGGYGNQLTVSNGGQVVSTSASVGELASSSNNAVLVTGASSLWSAPSGIAVGGAGSVNQLTIQNGGEVRAGANGLVIGRDATSTGNLVLVSGGTLTVTNASTSLEVRRGALILSSGTITANQLLMTNGSSSTFSASGGSLLAGMATIGGSFSLTNSTASFSSNLNVTGAGSLSGTNGLFVLSGNFINQSTNRAQFDLSRSTVFFTNGAGVSAHVLSLTNSGAMDMGAAGSALQLATNFSIGTLSLASNNNLTVTGMKSGGTTNALYVGWLDLSAWNTNAAALNSTLTAALTLSDINLYYDANDARNAYLNDQAYNIWGGGLLIPIPEPSAMTLTLAAGVLSAFILRWKRGRT